MPQLKILIVPCVEKGKGGGHIARSVRLSQELRALGKDTWVYINRSDLEIKEAITDLKDDKWDAIILDNFRTSPEEFARWRKIAPIIGIDEGGAFRKKFDFLIDILPNLERRKPNTANPSLLFTNNPERQTDPSSMRLRKATVAVTFGAEDAAGLTTPISLELLGQGFSVTAIFGSLNQTSALERKKLQEAGVEIWEKEKHLAERLAEFDLIVTHYGLTAFESLRAQTPVILASPTRYHENLARKAGFLTLRQIGKLTKDSLPRIIENNRILIEKYRLDLPQSLGAFLSRIEIHGANCPVCGNNPTSTAHTLARFVDRTYRKCPVCKTVFMTALFAPPIEYNHDYFFEAYKKQYGKTYIEDFPNLVKLGRKRLAWIEKIGRRRGEEPPSLLDIGCAYGPFLVAAKEAGFAPVGLETAEDAAEYVKNTLHIPCYRTTFPTRLTERYDTITLWFVIEHFEKTGEVLAESNRLLNPNGVLAFSTPSLAGISARKSRKTFLGNSPLDHYTVLDPRTIKTMLRRFGFSVKKIITTGIHPERFPVLGKFAQKNKILHVVLTLISRIFRLGDTFEVYAMKKETKQ
jgi:2-polyprenyl-3-methyl-5-hydroxy-6-metoxy-1,4-benzoquinol methylase/spore coat polysaccharide biosynthesis predicted glycosyltransferase SpsG